jgi:tetratricopeptide (TPR) repeat protein
MSPKTSIVFRPASHLHLMGLCLCLVAFSEVSAGPRNSNEDGKARPAVKSKGGLSGNALEDAEAGEIFGESAILVDAFTRRAMPELVESLLHDHPPACRIHIARANAAAASGAKDSVERALFMDRASNEYQKLIKNENSSAWMDDDRRKFLITQARFEWAGLILRCAAAEDLDQYEMTSGLQFERERLTQQLRQAVDLFSQARIALDAMEIGLRTQEERYLLLGLTEKIIQLAAQCRLDSAWAETYLAMASPPQTPDRVGLLLSALSKFDKAAESTRDTAMRNNALIGAGIALRENGQLREAQAAFTRVIDSTASIGIVARARYELARALLSGKQFDDARKELDSLGRIAPERFKGVDAGGRFYLRLAPVVHAFISITEVRQSRESPARDALSHQAMSELDEIARKNPSWLPIIRVYLSQLSGDSRDYEKMSQMQLSLAVQDLMRGEKYAQAISPLEMLLKKPSPQDSRDKARFNLAVCYFQTGQLRPAGELFLLAAESESREVSRPCAEYALRVWSRRAAESKSVDDYHKLAAAGELLVRRFPDHAESGDARWMAALARQEAGDLSEAVLAYQQISRKSPHWQDALRNSAICLQMILERMPADADRKPAARRAADAWLRAAEGSPDKSSDQKRWREARLAATTLLVSSTLQDYESALTALEPLADNPDAMLLKFRCLRGLGRIDDARQTLRKYLDTLTDSSNDSTLLHLTGQIQQEIDQLKHAGRDTQMRQAAADGVLVMEQLLEWLPGRTQYADYLPAVRIALIETMRAAGRDKDAAQRVEQYLAKDPGNGNLLYLAASIAQQQSDNDPSGNKDAADRAERLWSKLLQDQSLREQRPAMYWEARYYWLRYQLQHGRGQEVVRGIATEEAWYPDLGGPPWQTRLLELADEARGAPEKPTP